MAALTFWWENFRKGLLWFVQDQKLYPVVRLEKGSLFWGEERLALEDIPKKVPPFQKVDMVIAPSEVLTHTLRLPKAAKNSLLEAVKLEIERLTPFTLEDVYFDYALIQDSAQNIEVLLALCPKKKLDPWLLALSSAGVQVQKVILENASAIDLLRQNTTWPVIKLMTLAILFSALLLLPVFFGLTKIVLLHQEKKNLEIRLAKTATIQQTWLMQKEALKYPGAQKNAAPSTAMLLAELMRVLPAGIRLTALEIANGEANFWVVGENPNIMIEALASSPYFKNVTSSGAMTKTKGQAHVAINAKIKHAP